MLDVAKPLMILLTCFYGCGSKAFEPLHPEPIKVPLKGFHQEVNVAISFGARVVSAARHELMSSEKAVQIPSRMLMAVNREFRTFNGQR